MVSTSFGGPWTREKLDILGSYLEAYTTALKSQGFTLVYFDAFAGEGLWSPGAGYTDDDYGDFRELHRGSPLIALEIRDRAFDKLVFVEKDAARSDSLRKLVGDHSGRNIEVINDDANKVIPRFCDTLGAFDRAVVFLDPFATEVPWDTVAKIAQTEKIDCWILFPRGAIARMMPRNGPPPPALESRLDAIFGGREHWQGLYRPSPQMTLFEADRKQERPSSEAIADRYRERLESAFARVAPTRRTLTNSRNSPMFELFFAASNTRGAATAIRIADHILENW